MKRRDPLESLAGLVGAPWRVCGRTARGGLDCLGVIVAACEAWGLPLMDPASADPQIVRTSRLCDYFVPVVGEPDFGDAVHYLDPDAGDGAEAFTVEGSTRHLALVTCDGLLHATEKHGVCVTKELRQFEPRYFRHKTIATGLYLERRGSPA